MKTAETIFCFWFALVLLWWGISEPESAPQQSALAGQALVLLAGPYAIIATLQRSRNSHTNDGPSATAKEHT